MSATRKLLIALLSAVLLDLLIFKSGLYARITTSESMQGFGVTIVHGLQRQAPLPESRILLTGDSRLSEGFSPELARQVAAPYPLDIVNAGIPGTEIRDWYYLLKVIDPDANRYRAIVLTLPTFRAAPPPDGRLDIPYHATFMVPTLNAADYLDFVSSYSAWKSRLEVAEQWLIDPLDYQADFNDLLARPAKRVENFRWKNEVGVSFSDGYSSHPESMEGLSFNASNGSITYPDRLNEEQRKKIDADLHRIDASAASSVADWRSLWLSRIQQRYAASKTRIYVLRMPATPLPEADRDDSYPLMPFFARPQAGNPVRAIPEDLLLSLEKPGDFFDNRHLNNQGKIATTEKLTKFLLADLAANQ